MHKVRNYIDGVRLELLKVSWPKRSEVIRLTVVVFLISAIIGAYVGALDFIFTKLLELLVA